MLKVCTIKFWEWIAFTEMVPKVISIQFHEDQFLAGVLEFLVNPEINLVFTSDILEALFSVHFKTLISQNIIPATETKYHSDALKNLLDRFQFPVTILYTVVQFCIDFESNSL